MMVKLSVCVCLWNFVILIFSRKKNDDDDGDDDELLFVFGSC